MRNTTLVIVSSRRTITRRFHVRCEFKLPLVGVPIQLRYRVSFLEMYVLPRAGRPTITMTVGGLAKWGAPAAAKMESQLQSVFTGRHGQKEQQQQRNRELHRAAVYLHSPFSASFC